MSTTVNEETAPTQAPTDATEAPQNSTLSAGMAICGRCRAQWGGLNTCHCAGCHRTFTGITAFDHHRKGGECQHPNDIGLKLTDRKYECFGYPTDPTKPNHWDSK